MKSICFGKARKKSPKLCTSFSQTGTVNNDAFNPNRAVSGQDIKEIDMARNPVQFQKCISLDEFLSLYGTDDQRFDARYRR